MEKFEFEIVNNPSSNDLDFLTHKINTEAGDQGAAYPFAILVRNKESGIVAGFNGSIIFGSIYTDQFWVDPNLRKRGWVKS